ncbi:hypothetical protein [Shewanella baltica]|uniref:hypothetical protein n=1 Tax=Shewanella baltica TaxID=62322 RepID=UPI0011C026DB|nr:hypothetical protein [Shewanella baltica]
MIDTKIDQDGDGNTVAITSITDDTAPRQRLHHQRQHPDFNGTVDLVTTAPWPSPSMACLHHCQRLGD